MRKLTVDEVRSLITDIDNNEYLSEWKDFCFRYYGSKAYKVIGSVEAEYNDEGYDARLNSIKVYDKDNNELSQDLGEAKQQLREQLIQDFKRKFPVLDQVSWEKLADAELPSRLGDLTADGYYDDLYNIDYPGNIGSCGDDYSDTFKLIIGKQPKPVGTFYIED